MRKQVDKRKKPAGREKVFLLLAMATLIIFTFVAVDIRARQIETQEQLGWLQEWVGYILEDNARLEYLIDDLYRRREADNERLHGIEDFLEPARVEPHEITGYAPLDPRAVVGMCHDGNPNVTASGERPGHGRRQRPGGALRLAAGCTWQVGGGTG